MSTPPAPQTVISRAPAPVPLPAPAAAQTPEPPLAMRALRGIHDTYRCEELGPPCCLCMEALAAVPSERANADGDVIGAAPQPPPWDRVYHPDWDAWDRRGTCFSWLSGPARRAEAAGGQTAECLASWPLLLVADVLDLTAQITLCAGAAAVLVVACPVATVCGGCWLCHECGKPNNMFTLRIG